MTRMFFTGIPERMVLGQWLYCEGFRWVDEAIV